MLGASWTFRWGRTRGLGQPWAPPHWGQPPSPPTWPCRQAGVEGGHAATTEGPAWAPAASWTTPPPTFPALMGDGSPPMSPPHTSNGGTAELSGGGAAVGSSPGGGHGSTWPGGFIAGLQWHPGGVTTVLSVPQLGFPRDEVQEMPQALAPSGPRAWAGHEEDFAGMKKKAVIQSGSSHPSARPLHPKAGGQAAVPGTGWHSWGCGGHVARAVTGWAIESESN